jgi:putative ABC transport system permease protein
MSSIIADLKFALRMLTKTPGLSAIAVVTIAFGVGLTTHTYSTVYGSVIRGLDVPGAGRMVVLQQVDPERGISQGAFPYSDYADLSEREHGLEAVAGYYRGTVNLAGEAGPPERYAGAFVTANALEVTGVEPFLGRTFREGEDGPDARRQIVLSYHVWQGRFAGDPDIVGRIIRANGAATEVIGVMPEGFQFPFLEDLWVPVAYDRGVTGRRTQFMDVFGRVPEGVDRSVPLQALSVIAHDLAETYPEDNAGIEFTMIPFAERSMPPEITAVMYLMLAATFGVLLIACANVANLLLARASLRAREVAIRTAMGASRFRVLRQMLLESLVIALFGGALGVGVAWVGVEVFNGSIASIEKPYWIDVRLDGIALTFALGVTLVASLAAGIYPAVRASGLGLGDMLRDEGRGSSSLRLGRFSNALVIAEVAVSCGLLITAGFMIKSITNLKSLDMGFAAESVLTGRVGLFQTEYPTEQDRIAFFEQLQAGLQALPGVEVASLSTSLPGLGGSRWAVTVEGDTYETPRDHPVVNGNIVTSGYFDAIGTSLLQGRDFTAAEAWDASEPLAIVNQSFVQNVLGGRDPLGVRVRIGPTDSPNPFARIVGVVPDMHIGGGTGGIGDDQVNPEQMYVGPGPYDLRFMSMVVRTAGPPEALAPDLRRIVGDLDSNLPVYDLTSLARAIDEATWAFGLFGSLFTIFGLSALFLAAVGLYGVMAFSVTQRRQEMGVRMALGAGPDRILRLVLRKGIAQLSIGMTAGLGLGFLLSRPLSFVTFGVETTDPVVYGSIVLTLTAAGLLASVVPARSATRTDPVEAMRQ